MLKDDRKLRKVLFRTSIVIFFVWMVLGWDSCASQLELFVKNLPDYFSGNISWGDLVAIYHGEYGKGMHWSAFPIYGLCFWGLSRYYSDRLRLRGSRNICLSFGFTFLSIGLFEHFWHWSYYYFQNQPWILQWLWPQARILIQTLSFTFLGLFIVVLISLGHNKLYHLFDWKGTPYYWQPETHFKRYHLNMNKTTFILATLTFLSVFLWWFYPFPTEQLTVNVIGGSLWTSSKHFPQTVYTVETNLLDNISAGEQFYLRNDLLHGVNTVCKVLFTLTIYNIGKVKKP